jgi:dihydrofolate reductase
MEYMIRLIAAIDCRRGMAKNNGMPWFIPDDEQFFTDQTKRFGGNVLTGGSTFRLAYKNKPLADRQNFIATRYPQPIEGATVVNDLETFMNDFTDDLWISGGANIFEQVMNMKKADELYLTEIDADFGCDQFFPDYSAYVKTDQSPLREENGFIYSYIVYKKADTAT